jgi:hypothetical protein
MTRRLVQIVGVQALPTLLAFRHLRPAEVLLVAGRGLPGPARHLASVLAAEASVHTTEVHDPYDPARVYDELRQQLARLGWPPADLAYDLSGAIKPLAFGAFALARAVAAEMVDVEPGRAGFVLRRYAFAGDHAVAREVVTLPPLITLADYLNAHWGGFVAEGSSRGDDGRPSAGGAFEAALGRALSPRVDEVLAGVRPHGLGHQVEIDLVVRVANQVGIIEAKTGVNKAGLDQLGTAGDWLNMGLFTDKFLVTAGRFPPVLHRLAAAARIHVIELPAYRAGRDLTAADAERLARTVRMALADTTRPG